MRSADVPGEGDDWAPARTTSLRCDAGHIRTVIDSAGGVRWEDRDLPPAFPLTTDRTARLSFVDYYISLLLYMRAVILVHMDVFEAVAEPTRRALLDARAP